MEQRDLQGVSQRGESQRGESQRGEGGQGASEIPDKTYYRIGEVARITKVKPYVLRFWESEFKMMSPPKSRSKQRMYRRKDIDTILMIKKLLYEQGFTIKGARKKLAELQRDETAVAALEAPEAAPTLRNIRKQLEEIQRLLEPHGAGA